MPIKITKPGPEISTALLDKITAKPPKAKKPTKAPATRGRTASSNYNSLRLQWLRMNLDIESTEFYTIQQLADDHGLKFDTLSRVARGQGWHNTLEEMRAEIAEQGKRQLIAATGFDEVAIRKKHAHFANIAMNKAIIGLMAIDPHQLSAHALVLLLQLGLAEEKKAYGMVESVTGSVNLKPGEMQESVQSAAQQAMDILNKKLEKTIDAQGEIIDATPSI